MITVKLLGSNQEIQRNINKAIAEHFNKIIRNKNRKILGKLKFSVDNWVRSQPEIESLLSEGQSNSLNAQFGIRSGNGESAVEAIVSAVVDATQINIKKLNEKLEGGIDFLFQPKDFQNLLALPQGHTITEKGADLHWLDWLLTAGDRIVVVGYKYKPDSEGRSGGGVMEGGGSFRVDPKFSGTLENNFITRALSGNDKELSATISEIFT